MKGPGGQLTAVEVRRFPKPLNPGHRPFDGRDDQTMTNATVEAMVQGLERPRADDDLPGRRAEDRRARVGLRSRRWCPASAISSWSGAPVNLTHDASGIALRIQVGPKR